MLVAEGIHSLEIDLILDERRCQPFGLLAALVDVKSAAHRNLGAILVSAIVTVMVAANHVTTATDKLAVTHVAMAAMIGMVCSGLVT